MGTPSIVVVEGYSAMGLLLDDLLTGAGYNVRLWPTSTGAFEFIRQEHPDLVILDSSLKQRGDGLAVLDQLWRDAATRDIPVIVMVEDSHLVSMMRALPDGQSSVVLEKPFYLEQLLAKVRLVIGLPCAVLNDGGNNTVGQWEALLSDA